MRSLPFSPTLALGLPALITIQRGTSTLCFTTHNESITANGFTYAPGPGASLSDMQFPSDGSPASCDITIFAETGAVVEPGDGLSGKLDGWPISIELIDIGNTAAGTYDFFPGSTISTVTEDGTGNVVISVNGPLNRTRGPITEHYSLLGREDLGDDRCKVPILPAEIQRSTAYVQVDVAGGLQAVNDCYGRVATGVAGTVDDYANVYYECTTAGTTASVAPTYDPTVGNTTTDGTAVFTARNAWLRYARGVRTGDFTIQLTALPDSRAADDTWYVLGGLYLRSGPRANFEKLDIRAWDHSTLTLTMFLPIGANDIPSNTQIEIHPGCDRTPEMCYSRFNDTINRRSENYAPEDNNMGAVF